MTISYTATAFHKISFEEVVYAHTLEPVLYKPGFTMELDGLHSPPGFRIRNLPIYVFRVVITTYKYLPVFCSNGVILEVLPLLSVHASVFRLPCLSSFYVSLDLLMFLTGLDFIFESSTRCVLARRFGCFFPHEGRLASCRGLAEGASARLQKSRMAPIIADLTTVLVYELQTKINTNESTTNKQ